MTGLQLALGESTLSAFLLAVARIAGFVVVTPPFNTRSVPAQAKVAAVLSLVLWSLVVIAGRSIGYTPISTTPVPSAELNVAPDPTLRPR